MKPTILQCTLVNLCVLLTALSVDFLISCNNTPDNKILNHSEVESKVLPILQQYINGQYEYLIGVAKERKWEKYETKERIADSKLKVTIDQFAADLSKINFK